MFIRIESARVLNSNACVSFGMTYGWVEVGWTVVHSFGEDCSARGIKDSDGDWVEVLRLGGGYGEV